MQFALWPRSFALVLRPLARRNVPHVSYFSSTPTRLARSKFNIDLNKSYVSLDPAPAARAMRGRSLAQGIRRHLETRDTQSALALANAAILADQNTTQSSVDLFSSVNFRFNVSSRLPLHTLVHGLLRTGKPFAAAEYAHARMLEGHRIRMGTMEAIVSSLCDADAGPSKADLAVMGWAGHFAVENQQLQLAHPDLSDGTRVAVQLLRCARNTRNNRSSRMYDRLIDACLLQGEIVVAALLFALLVRDWQLRRALSNAPSLEGATSYGSPEVDGHPLSVEHIRAASKLRLDDRRLTIPHPKMETLQRILDNISFDERQQRGRIKDPSLSQVYQMKKAAYHLAELLEHRQLEFNILANLIAVLSRIPREPSVYVEKIVDGHPVEVEVYTSVHDTLYKFAHRLPVHRNAVSAKTPSLIYPPNIRTYNTLLDYLLRHRMDLDSASALLAHMNIPRRHPVKPNQVTYNIILRRASLLRRNDIVQRLMKQIVDASTPNLAVKPIATVETNRTETRNQWKKTGETASKGSFLSALEELGTRDLNLWDTQVMQATPNSLTPDGRMLCVYLAHLGSTGQHERAIQLLYKYFPELKPVSSRPSMTLRQRLRDAATRGVILGPYFFGTAIAVLKRAGKTSLAERVWYLGQVSEEASWSADPKVNRGVKPWTMDVTAYTAMLQCYAREARIGLAHAQRNQHLVVGWSYFNWLRGTDLGPSYHPRQMSYSATPHPRATTAREMAHMLLVSMRTRAQLVWRTMVRQRGSDVRRPEAPRRDARFYNSVLELFGRRLHVSRRRSVAGIGHRAWRYRCAVHDHIRHGFVPPRRDPFLLEIVREMVRDGFKVPIGIRHSLIGHDIDVEPARRLPREPTAPYRYPVPVRKELLAYALPTTKTKGLPVPNSNWGAVGSDKRENNWRRRWTRGEVATANPTQSTRSKSDKRETKSAFSAPRRRMQASMRVATATASRDPNRRRSIPPRIPV